MTTPETLVQTRHMLRAEGFTDAEIRASIDRTSRTRLWKGAYIDTPEYAALTSDERHQARIIAVATRTAGAVVSHGSAAALHGLPLVHYDTSVVHFTRRGRTGGKRVPGRWMHSTTTRLGTALVSGVAVTQSARTVLDVATTEKFTTALVVADAALRNGLVTHDELADELAITPTRPGIPRARRVIDWADGAAESPGESLTRCAIRQAKLPSPEPQLEIVDDHGLFVGRVDLAYREQGIAIEFDGRIKYTALLGPGQSVTDVVLAEKQREERLTRLGWLVIRVTWDDMRAPEVFIGRLARALHERANWRERGRLLGGTR